MPQTRAPWIPEAQRLRDAGQTVRQIAAVIGVTYQRVAQQLGPYLVPAEHVIGHCACGTFLRMTQKRKFFCCYQCAQRTHVWNRQTRLGNRQPREEWRWTHSKGCTLIEKEAP